MAFTLYPTMPRSYADLPQIKCRALMTRRFLAMFSHPDGFRTIAFSVVLTLAAALAVVWVVSSQHQRRLDSQRAETVEKLGRIRADIESLLTGSLSLTQGMAATLYAHGRLTDEEFAATAEKLVAGRAEVRNLAIAYGTVVRQVYPRPGNEGALGLDYRSNERQWPGVRQAIADGKTVVVGPLPLVQGGSGVISRTPVFRPDRPGGEPVYFGLCSIVVDLSTVMRRAGLDAPGQDIEVAIEADGQVFHGSPDVLTRNPVAADIQFPGGNWRIHALPAAGWSPSAWRADPGLSLIGAALVALVAMSSLAAALAWSHRDRLIASLRDSEARYRHLLDTAPAAIVLHRHGRLFFANREAVRLMAASGPQDLINRPMLDCIHPDYHSVVSDRMASLRDVGDEVPPIRLKLIALDGRVVDADVSSSSVRVDGQNAVLAIAVDATRTVRAEAQRQAILDDLQRSNDELRQFTSAASHDLQEPLRQVATYVQMLERRYQPVLDQDGRDFIRFAVDGVMHMRRLLHDLGLYAHLQGSGAPLRRLDLGAVVDRARADLDDRVHRLGARISHAGLPAVMGDEDQIKQVFDNLLDNALRYARTGVPPVVTVSAMRQGAFWRVAVADNGIGIAPEYHTSIFDVFTRLHGAGHTEGTGFGLAICRRVIERHGGQIWVESQSDRGSTFFFTLPVA